MDIFKRHSKILSRASPLFRQFRFFYSGLFWMCFGILKCLHLGQNILALFADGTLNTPESDSAAKALAN